ncbi:MAG: glycosyltransferase family 2 protein [Anaerolineaceae bacterium]|nr:glycosyltransferase family 2 protein [Anaerolineaceae bacterium]
MTKLVIQIPALNEAATLPSVLSEIPREIPGVDEILVIVIDDGSSDGTANIALTNGADAVIRHRSTRGLSRAFITGIQFALALGADIIVNTDGDNQYPGASIPELIRPILADEADLVIGDRQPLKNMNFSPFKRWMEAAGSAYIRSISNTQVNDAVSGFRAFSRYAALPMQVYNPYSYTLETLIQAGKSRLNIAQVPITTNPNLRRSRLHKGIFHFIGNQAGAILRSYVLYQPLRTFLSMGGVSVLMGLILLIRFLVFYMMKQGNGHLQSVSIAGSLLIIGIVLIIIGFLADSSRAAREVQEELVVHKRDTFVIENLQALERFEGQPVYTRKHLQGSENLPEFLRSKRTI